MQATASAILFKSDSDFLVWTQQQPEGVVVNLRYYLNADYAVLHRATCGSLVVRRYDEGALTTRAYLKVGAQTEEMLRQWLSANVIRSAGFTQRCGICRP